VQVRPIQATEVDAAALTLALAFRHDPVWGIALELPDASDQHLVPYWRQYVEGARRYETAFVSTDAGTVSMWIPPGGAELSDDQEAALRELAAQTFDHEQASALCELWERFDQHRPHEEPHAYLSLLATRPTHAGHGHGQAHLAADLARWDAAGLPAYLESSNPVNDHRYARQGFVRIGQFETVLDRAVVTTMWRPVGG
jgi:ribosomal protein S18 acetylase RimI-like enzyme